MKRTLRGGILLASLVASTAAAQGRLVGNHLFTPPLGFDPAYVQTSVEFIQGGGYLRRPDFDAGIGKPFDLELAGVRDRLLLQGRLGSRVSLFARAVADAFSGINGRTAFFRGLGFGGEWRAGIAGEALRTNGVVLGARAGVVGTFGTRLDPSRLLRSVIDRPVSTVGQVILERRTEFLLVDDSSLGGVGDLALAVPFGAWLGLQLGVEGSVADASTTGRLLDGLHDDSETALEYRLGAAVDLTPPDLPLAFLCEVDYRRDVGGGRARADDALTTISLGAFLRDAEAFELGLALATDVAGRAETTTGQLVLRYFH